jgi:hypothetical protein
MILLAQVAAAGVFTLAFAWWCPFREARVVMYDIVGDVWPRLTRLIWNDVATIQKAEKARRRA